jgi:hypothetical protein
MDISLPSTPAEVLEISTTELQREIIQKVNQANDSGIWLYPDKTAATLLEEMTVKDMAYWVYKCKKPIINYEKNFQHNKYNPVSLPKEFRKISSITFGAIGDLLQYEGLENSKDILFDSVSNLLFDKTVSLANFESPVTKQPLKKEIIGDKEAPIECCNYNQFKSLASHKGKYFSVMNIANNHILDMGIEGIQTTFQSFKNSNIIGIGISETPDEFGRGKVLDVNGIKLGFVASTFGLNGHKMPDSETYITL